MQQQELLKIVADFPRSYIDSKRFKTRPMQAIIDVTMKCPASCQYCATWRIEHKNLTTEELTTIIRKLRKMGVILLGFSGGEPLIRKDLPELVRRASGLGMMVSTVTSGFVNKGEIFQALMANGLSVITFSIDGATKEMHESFRTGTSFEKVIQTLQTAIAIRKEHGFATRINSQTVITRNNIHALEAIVEMVQRLGVDHCSFQPVWPTVEFEHFVDKFGFDARDKDLLFKAREVLRKVPNANLAEYIDLLPDFYLDYPKIQREVECYAGRSFVHVDYKGQLLPCAFYPEAFGSILDEEPEQLLQGDRHTRMLRQAARQEICGGCSLTCHMERNIMLRNVTKPVTLLRMISQRFRSRNGGRPRALGA